MKRVLFVFSPLLLLVVAVMVLSCSSDENEDVTEFVNFPASGKKVPIQFVDEGKIPNWLIEIAKQFPSGDAAITKTHIYSGIWEGMPIYLVYHSLMSSFYYHLYDSSGTRLEYGDNMGVMETSHSWKCIYIR